MCHSSIAAVTYCALVALTLGPSPGLQASVIPPNAGGGEYHDASTSATTASAGDANGDGILTSGDVFYLINHLFAGGPAPATLAGSGTVSVRFEQVFDAGTSMVVPTAQPILGPYAVNVGQSQRIWVQSSVYVEFSSGSEVWTQVVISGANNNQIVSVWAVAKDNGYIPGSWYGGNQYWLSGQTLNNQLVTPPLAAGTYNVCVTVVASKTIAASLSPIKPGDRSMLIAVLAQ